MFFMLFVLVHSAQHAAPINRRRGQKDKVKGHSVQQRGDFTPTTTATAAVAVDLELAVVGGRFRRLGRGGATT